MHFCKNFQLFVYRSTCRNDLAISVIELGPDNVMDIIRVADMINDEKMFRAGINFIVKNLQQFTETDRWKNFLDENGDCIKKVLKALLFKPCFYLDRAILKDDT